MLDIKKQLEQIKRGSEGLISEEELIKKLKTGKPLRVKVGFDPTNADLHLGHTILMHKMRQFQDLGHQVIFLVGDYTAQIGDPSGRDETRPTLSEDVIKKNAETYLDQAAKILDMKRAEIRRNSEWLGKMTGVDFIKLSSKHTVARMLERDDFKQRYSNNIPIRIHEFIYPLLQGQDSVELEADVELGGTDQIFNLLVGRDLQRDCGKESQVVLTMPLLVGTDGVQKMSKSYGNYIGITEEPKEIFGKIMSISDDLMWEYYKLVSLKSLDEVAKYKKDCKAGKIHPKNAKVTLAKEIVARFYSEKDADEAEQEFDRIFSKKKLPTEMETENISSDCSDIKVVDLITRLKMVSSKTEARRMIEQGGVYINDQRLSSKEGSIECEGEYIVRVGKRRFKKVLFK